MPKNIGDHEEPSIFGVDEPTQAEAAGEEPTVEEVPRGRSEHGRASDSLTVERRSADDAGEPAKPLEATKAPSSKASTTHATHKPGPKGSASKSGDGDDA